jgi:hypothetical protein
MVDPYSIVEAYKDKSDSNQEKVHKFSLGLPFMPKSNALTLSEVYSCCGYKPECETYDRPSIMGVDVGGSSGFHVVIGIKTNKSSYEVFRVDCLEGFEDVLLLANRFNVKVGVCDMLPELTAARKFQKEAKGMGMKIWLNIYNTSNPVDEVVWDDETRVVKTYRNYIFDTSHRVVADGMVVLPRRSRKIEEFARQYIVPVKLRDDKKNTFRYFSPSSKDHYRNSMNYFLIASFVSRITRPDGYKSKKKYVVNSEKRYI